jgi:beta-glucanase (GH16 family)
MCSNSGRGMFSGKLASSWSLGITLLILLATACSSKNAPSEENHSDGSGVARLHRGLIACPGPALMWFDEFDGTALDDSKWSHQLGNGCGSSAGCGWGNNELQTYQPGNVIVSEGTLKIEAREQRIHSNAYTSGKIRSLDKGDFDYGRFEARMKLPIGQGIWPAFWMMPTDELYGGWPESGEIDIMENIGSEPSTVHGTLHFGEPWPNNNQTGGSYSLPDGQRFTDSFHVFAIEKEPGVMRWIIDGVLFSTKTSDDTDPYWPFDERYHFILNLAVGGNWPGDPDATTVFPQTFEVDYVRVYARRPYLIGDSQVDYSESGVVYSVGNASSSTTFNWTVPGDATFDLGPSTHSITVDWGSASGAVTATPNCGEEVLTMDVIVDPPCTVNANCDDSNLCNGAETCSAGLCVAGTALDCDDTNACTVDSCEPTLGCLHDILMCDDGLLCSVDSCDIDTGCVYDTSNCPVLCAAKGASCNSNDKCCSLNCKQGSCKGGR